MLVAVNVLINYNFFVSTLCISDSFGWLTKKPQNALVVGNRAVQLNCSTDGVHNLLEWTYDHDTIVWSPCTSQKSRTFIASSPNHATDCNVRVVPSSYDTISGAYVCRDRKEKAIAMIIVLGSIPLYWLLCSQIHPYLLQLIVLLDTVTYYCHDDVVCMSVCLSVCVAVHGV